MKGVPQQSVRDTSSSLAVFSAATLQVALFSVLIPIISSVDCLFVVRFATPTCRLTRLRVGDDLLLKQGIVGDKARYSWG